MLFAYGNNNMTRYSAGDDPETEDSLDENIVIHVTPETRTRWNHIKDLDWFFERIYLYHQNHGFICIVLSNFFWIFQILFVVAFSTFLHNCVDYDLLFRNKLPENNGTKVTLNDVIIDADQCVKSFSTITWMFLAATCIFGFVHIWRTFQYWEIRCFYLNALNIRDADLNNLTWHEVIQKLRQAQSEYQICIHKQDLSELDIYHRILRFENFMVALFNKSVLPVKFSIPLLGELVFYSKAYNFNMTNLLFYGPWAPFENSWKLKDDYKRPNRRRELAQSYSRTVTYYAIGNLVLMPGIMLWTVLFTFFSYAEQIKREPGSLGTRRWSLFGKRYLRHFNELDHELKARLSRAYRPANQYLSGFTSPLMNLLAQNVAFVCGAVLGVIIALTIYDEDVITVHNVLAIITALTAIVAVCRSSIPDENSVWNPESLLEAVVSQIHYFPCDWKGKAHTTQVRSELEKVFPYTLAHLLEELLSPIVLPFILYFYVRPKAQEIVDFLRQFTIEVVGVGDVCSFAQLDLNKHGHPLWQPNDGDVPESPQPTEPVKQAENGKTELSLVHFAISNPKWKPPRMAEGFLSAIKNQLQNEMWLHPNIHSSCGLPVSHCPCAVQSGMFGGPGRFSHSVNCATFPSGVVRQDERRSYIEGRSTLSGSFDR